MKILKAIYNILALLVGAPCQWQRDAIDAGICDYSGQGRDHLAPPAPVQQKPIDTDRSDMV